MNIKPILFNTEMVQSILGGLKTCTRRLVKFLPGENPQWTGYIKDGLMLYNGTNEPCCRKPPYKIGDVLYVRETWQKAWLVDDFDQVVDGTEKYYYAAGPETPCFDFWVDPETGEHKERMPWRPSIHMPKEAARIFLKVTDVRVERLQEITMDDCHREGINIATSSVTDGETLKRNHDFSLEKFETLWDSTIKKSDLDRYGWDANPWVWVIKFERCEKPPKCILKGYDKAPDDGSEKCLGYMYDNRDELLPMCEKCSYQASYESEE